MAEAHRRFHLKALNQIQTQISPLDMLFLRERIKKAFRRSISGGDINRRSGNSVSFISSEPDLTASRSRSGNLSLDNSFGISTTRSTNTVSGISDQSANSLSP